MGIGTTEMFKNAKVAAIALILLAATSVTAPAHAAERAISVPGCAKSTAKGACPACDGYGYKKIELQFLPDTYIPCELCQGKRYKTEILWIKRRGKTISEILGMYVKDALELFSEIDHIREELELMVKIGLGYLRMGQPAHTLSGGESQRLKLVKHLLKSYKGHTMYFLDEPTVWLHSEDIVKLLKVIKEFLDKGDTILMIEHDKSILKFADEVIRLENGKLVK